MAKKAPMNEPPYSPVKSGLVHAVLSTRVIGNESAVRDLRSDGVTRIAARKATDIRQSEALAPQARKSCALLIREKRVLLSQREEIAVNELVHQLSATGATTLKLSHLLRACILLLRHCEGELVERVRMAQPLIRPANDNSSSLEEFERRLAREVAAAVRSAAPLPG